MNYSQLDKDYILSQSYFSYPWSIDLPEINYDLRDKLYALIEENKVFDNIEGFYKKFDSYQPEIMGSWTFFLASSENQFICALFLMYFTLFDDVLEGTDEEEIDMLVKASAGKPIDAEGKQRPGINVLLYIGNYVRNNMSKEWIDLYERHLNEYFSGIKQENALLNSLDNYGHPSMVEYMNCRKYTSGVDLIIDFIDVAMLPNSLAIHKYDNSLFKEIRRSVVNILIYMNDYISIIRGRDYGKLNTSFAICKDFGVGMPESTNILLNIHNAAVIKFVRQCEDLINSYGVNNTEILLWVKNVQNVISGFALWHCVADRFK